LNKDATIMGDPLLWHYGSAQWIPVKGRWCLRLGSKNRYGSCVSGR